jgi:hypothetical protein
MLGFFAGASVAWSAASGVSSRAVTVINVSLFMGVFARYVFVDKFQVSRVGPLPDIRKSSAF